MINIINLSKIFNNNLAVNDLNLNVRKGEIFGFIGPNGAGKTTTIKMITGLLKPTTGKIIIDNTVFMLNLVILVLPLKIGLKKLYEMDF